MTDRRRLAANADPDSGSDTGSDTGSGSETGSERERGEERARGRARDDGRDRDRSQQDNPFAPPPEGRPDRPWRPRHPHGDDGRSGDEPTGDEGRDGRGPHRGGRWSSQQPGRQDGGFGRPAGAGGSGGGSGGRRPGLRWDPTDPKQRHARYALHAGIWGLFFAMFGMVEIAMLLGALSVYWGVNALRGPSSVRSAPGAHATAEDVAGTDRRGTGSGADGGTGGGTGGGGPYGARPAGTEVTVTPAQAAKARRAAAISGLVAGILALLGVAGDFAQRMVYEEYYTCRQDALTQSAREQCEELPDDQVPFWNTDPGAGPNG